MKNIESEQPFCFVLMPFGEKPDGNGGTIDFDAVYQKVILPAVVAAKMEPIRADEEQVGGIIHKPMFERLILCEYAVADLTTANANVFYELGIRHAVKPCTTTTIFASGTRLPFDLRPLRGLPYELDVSGLPSQAKADSMALEKMLIAQKKESYVDSPLFQLIADMRPPETKHLVTDVFRSRVRNCNAIKRRIDLACDKCDLDEAVSELKSIQDDIGVEGLSQADVCVDLLLAFRSKNAFQEMAKLIELMTEPLASSSLVREQYAFALNRTGEHEKAERIIKRLIEECGMSSESMGLLGRTYKDRWEIAKKNGNSFQAQAFLQQAIDAYIAGFETDMRDSYPGVNAVTLMELLTESDPRQAKLLPVVRYSATRRISQNEPDYWDCASMLELEVLAKNESNAMKWLLKAIPLINEPWQSMTTIRNLRLIREANESRGESIEWVKTIEGELAKITCK